MIRSAEASGKNLDLAIEKALKELGLTPDEEYSVEVLERAKSGFLGFGGSDARVRVTVELPDPKPVRAPEPPRVSAPAKAPAAPAKPAAEKPAPPQKGQGRPQQQSKPAQQVKSAAQPKPAPQQAKNAQPRPAKAAPARDAAPKNAPPAGPVKPMSVELAAGSARAARAGTFMQGLLEKMEIEADVRVEADEDGNLALQLSGEKMGALIGRRGDTLDAIQRLTGFVVNRGEEDRVRVTVDTENYRQTREDSLRRLARKTAGRAAKLKRNLTLEPMNAYERHVIHAELQEWKDVSTFSTGAEPRRCVVVAYTPGGRRFATDSKYYNQKPSAREE